MKEALKLIKKNKKTKSPILNLSYCGLINELPHQLFECVWIEQLNLGGGVYDLVNFSWVETSRQYGNGNVFKGPELERLRELPNLKELCCTYNSIEDASFLAGLTSLCKLQLWHNKIKDLNPLQNLLNLELLNIGHNPVLSLAPLAYLSKLKNLSLDCNTKFDLSVLKDLPSLTDLDLCNTGPKSCSTVSSLTQLRKLEMRKCYIQSADFIKDLINLYHLNIEDNEIENVDFLKDLKSLSYLNFSKNKVSYFDPAYIKQPYNISYLRLWDNPIKNVPALVRDRYNCIYAIREHFNINTQDPRVENLTQSQIPKTTASLPPSPVPSSVEKTSWMPFIIMIAICGLIGSVFAGLKLQGFVVGVIIGPTILSLLVGFSSKRTRRNRW